MLVLSIHSLFLNFPAYRDFLPLAQIPCAERNLLNTISAVANHLVSTVLEACVAHSHPDSRCIAYFDRELSHTLQDSSSEFLCPGFSDFFDSASAHFRRSLAEFRAIMSEAATVVAANERRRVGALRTSQALRTKALEKFKPSGEPLSFGFGLRVPWTNFQVQAASGPGQRGIGRVAYVDYEVEGKKIRLLRGD
jgi:hypothetical protein